MKSHSGTFISDLSADVDAQLDRQAAKQAIDELGDGVSINDLVKRAEEIRAGTKSPTASQWDRFLSNGAPDEFDHDREEES